MSVILIVDDMPIFREPIEAVLRTEGFETATAANGHEALAAMARQRPALVLLDLGMPVMGGLACLRTMRASRLLRATPVIILSADADRSHITEAVKLGISGYLLKSGFSLKAMLEKVRAALGPGGAAGAPPPPGAKPAMAGVTPEAPSSSAAPEPPLRSGAHAAPAGTAPAHARAVKPMGAINRDASNGADVKLLKPVISRSDLMDRLKMCEELKGFSPAVSQVLKLTSSPECSLDEVAKAMRQDQALALKILKVANSSVYSRGDRVDTVHKAILRIGMASIRQVVLSICVVERFRAAAFQEHLSTAQFWEHSIACGIIAAEISRAMGEKEADSSFVSGLLHDMGRVVFAEVLGEQYIGVIEAARSMAVPLEIVETRMLLLNHADVMDRLLTMWKFPKQLVDPILHHHLSADNVRSVAPSRAAEILRLGLANRLAHAMLLGNSGNETIYPTEEYCRLLDLSAATIRAVEETARQQTDDTKYALLSSTSSAGWPHRAEQVRAQLTAPFRPLHISMAPDFDAYRILCDALAGPCGDDPPNVAVVHITSAKERGPLAERLASAEREAGVQDLPLLVLSPTGQLGLDAASIERRASHTLLTPTPVSMFVAATNALLGADSSRVAA